jgi:tRNA(Glu) U13 pseudouridine synthase TruD
MIEIDEPQEEYDESRRSQSQNIRIQFNLGVGCYATAFLRELLANDRLL